MSTSPRHYETRLVMFLDILGFRNIVMETVDTPQALEDVLSALDLLAVSGEDDFYESKVVSQFSDSIVVSYRASEQSGTFALLNRLHWLVINMASRGYLIRGGVTVGNLVHTPQYLVGPAVVRAYDMEAKDATYPRVLVDPAVLELARTYHAAHHTPDMEETYVRALLAVDAEDERFFFDFVSWKSVVVVAGSEVEEYGPYLACLGKLIEKGLANPNECIRKKYLWLHRQYIAAIEYIASTPADSEFRLENPGVCEEIAALPRFDELALAARG